MNESAAKALRHHVHCFICGKALSESEATRTTMQAPVRAPVGKTEDGQIIIGTIGQVSIPGFLCPEHDAEMQQAAQKAAEEAEAAKARSRLVVARGPVRPL